VRVGGKKLVLNYRTAPGGSLGVELQDAAGKPLAAFTAAKAQLQGDNLAAPVAWSGNSDLSTLANQPVRIRFTLNDAELYSLRFE
jgi:hypothetical protein